MGNITQVKQRVNSVEDGDTGFPSQSTDDSRLSRIVNVNANGHMRPSNKLVTCPGCDPKTAEMTAPRDQDSTT